MAADAATTMARRRGFVFWRENRPSIGVWTDAEYSLEGCCLTLKILLILLRDSCFNAAGRENTKRSTFNAENKRALKIELKLQGYWFNTSSRRYVLC